MLDTNGSRTVSVDKAALKELKDCVRIGLFHLKGELYTQQFPHVPEVEVLAQIERLNEAICNIECSSTEERVDHLMGRLSKDPNYHRRDIEALNALLQDKAGE